MKTQKIVPVVLIAAILAVLGILLMMPVPTTPSAIKENPMENGVYEETKTYSYVELSEHSKIDDCWLAISGRVYDVTDFVSSHPGGEAITEGCGSDATELYETRPMGSGTPHSDMARGMLDDYYIGDIEE